MTNREDSFNNILRETYGGLSDPCPKCKHDWTGSTFEYASLIICPKCKCPKCKTRLPFNLRKFLILANCTHGFKYNYSLVTDGHTRIRSNKAPIICNECNHQWDQLISNHLRGNGCPKCASRKRLMSSSPIDDVVEGRYKAKSITYLKKTKKGVLVKPPSSLIILDVETTGLPKSSIDGYEYFDTRRITEISWSVVHQGEIVIIRTYLLKSSLSALSDPEVQNNPFVKVQPGEIQEKGVEWPVVINALFEDGQGSLPICAHNINFDTGMVLSELYRISSFESEALIDYLLSCDWYDTLYSIGGRKKLGIVYKELVGREIEEGEQHRAEYDVNLVYEILQKILQ